MPNRASGVLTSVDSEFLRSEGDYYSGEYARQSRYDRQRAIRERIVRSVLDFSEIREHLDSDQRRKIFASPHENGANSFYEFYLALTDLIGWIYLGCREEEQDFKDIIETGVHAAESEYQSQTGGGSVDININFGVEVSKPSMRARKLAQDLIEGNPIDFLEFMDLVITGEFEGISVDPDQVDTVKYIPDNSFSGNEEEPLGYLLQTGLGIEADIERVNATSEEETNKE